MESVFKIVKYAELESTETLRELWAPSYSLLHHFGFLTLQFNRT
jgi:hypothetical protein